MTIQEKQINSRMDQKLPLLKQIYITPPNGENQITLRLDLLADGKTEPVSMQVSWNGLVNLMELLHVYHEKHKILLDQKPAVQPPGSAFRPWKQYRQVKKAVVLDCEKRELWLIPYACVCDCPLQPLRGGMTGRSRLTTN
jgi:hypothetical protein